MPSCCQRYCRSKATRSPHGRPRGPTGTCGSRPSSQRSRPRSTRAASSSTASTRRTDRAITEGFGGRPPNERRDGETEAPEDDAIEEGDDPRARLMQCALRRSWCPGQWASPSAASTCASPPARERCPPSPSPSTRCRSARPACSPAEDGLPLDGAPAGYPLAFPENGMLVDDPGHPRDLTAAVRAVFELVFGARADAIVGGGCGAARPEGPRPARLARRELLRAPPQAPLQEPAQGADRLAARRCPPAATACGSTPTDSRATASSRSRTTSWRPSSPTRSGSSRA